MASRQHAKETARQARVAAEQAASAQAAQRRRLRIIVGVVIVAVVVAVVAVVISSSGSGSQGIQTGTAATAIQSTVEHELQGIPQHGRTLGSPGAKVTIQYFGDLECPVCRALTLGIDGGGLPALISGPVRRGAIKLVYRSSETATFGTNNARWIPQQTAAYAAGEQDRFWQYAELFYHEQGDESSHYVTEAYLQGLARQIPALDFSQWMTDRTNPALARQVAADGALSDRDAIHSTPTLVAIGPRSEAIVQSATGIPTYSEIMSTVKAVS